MNIHIFQNDSKIATDGYDLFYIDIDGQAYKLTTIKDKNPVNGIFVPTGIDYLKASDNALYFVNFNGESVRLCEDTSITQGEIELCLNSLIDCTYQNNEYKNENNDCFYKFSNTKTVLMSVGKHLYCRFGETKKIVKLS